MSTGLRQLDKEFPKLVAKLIMVKEIFRNLEESNQQIQEDQEVNDVGYIITLVTTLYGGVRYFKISQ